jgi:phosphatidylethanolamine N-methyltransferase
MDPPDKPSSDVSQLRERLPNKPEKPRKAVSIEAAKEVVKEPGYTEDKHNDSKSKEKRTYGRTPDGTGM